jgi:cation transport ATPase
VPPTVARTREEQGRLFWVWVLTLPILLLLGASAAFAAPWPNQLTQRIGQALLAFPVLFVVGEPLLHSASAALRGEVKAPLAVITAAVALACYGSGLLAIVGLAPPLAGVSAVVVSTYLSLRYVAGRY